MTQRTLKILFLGGGSIGAIYAFLLSRQNCTITIVVRSSFPVVSRHGYKLTSTTFGNTIYIPYRVISSPLDLSGDEIYDYIFITTKASSSSLPLQGYPVSPATTIVLIQNGIGVEAAYKAAYPDTPLLSGVAYIIASQPSPGEILQSGSVMSLHLGAFPPSSELQEHKDIVSRLTAAGLQTHLHPSILPQRWKKLLFNSCYATICAVTGLGTLAVAQMPGGLEMLLALGHEIRETAGAAGECEMSVEEIEEFFEVQTKGLDIVPSMLQDAQKGQEMEVEVLVRNVVKIAEKWGVEVPRLRAVCTILGGMNERFRMEREKKLLDGEGFRCGGGGGGGGGRLQAKLVIGC
ncbi:ketopantoate reductase PanE/ApbA-domain-containing protein [Trichophaea hybrida]|nr:ketopantoate reductase PanE/ApbA-domain-containing protein [Trichophaea hybrida]